MLEKWRRLAREAEDEFLARAREAAALHACRDGVERPAARARRRRQIVWKKHAQRERLAPPADDTRAMPVDERENTRNVDTCAEKPDTVRAVSGAAGSTHAADDENLRLNTAFLQLKSQLADGMGDEALFREKNLYRAAVINSLRRSPFRARGFDPGLYRPQTVVPAIDSDDEVGMDVGFRTPLWAKDPRINERVRAQPHEELAQYFRSEAPINAPMERKESQEPRKRVSWGTTDIKYFYAAAERQAEGAGLDCSDTVDILDCSRPCGAVEHAAVDDAAAIQRELEQDFDKNLFDMNMAAILGECVDGVPSVPADTLGLQATCGDVENVTNQAAAQAHVLQKGAEHAAADDAIDTADVRRMVGEARECVRLDEELARHGVRFYYQAAVGNRRRDTVSKSATQPAPDMVLYYRNFLRVQIAYFSEFTSFLEQRMAEEDESTRVQEQFIDLGMFREQGISGRLKALKQMCRAKAKIRWYEIRKARELGLCSAVTGNKNRMAEDFNALETRNTAVLERTAEVQALCSAQDARLQDLRARLGSAVPGTPPETAERIIREQRMVVASCRSELADLLGAERAARAELDALSAQRAALEAEVQQLEAAIAGRCVGEAELDAARSAYADAVSAFDVEVLALRQGLFKVRAGEYVCSFGVDGDPACVRDLAVEVRNVPGKFVYSMFPRERDPRGVPLAEAVADMLRTYTRARALVQDLRLVEARHRVMVSERAGVLCVDVALADAACSGAALAFRVEGAACVVAEFRGQEMRGLPEYGFVSHCVDAVCSGRSLDGE
ncbi:UNVERIFIED_CONTAM: hypothetical protein PYX00_011799 [Menopon gallinae]|uniref:Uncharacterized protein n=1 Tax=Menopon gallinae TaxID=328185 RepID=A0AAW2H8R6_9NEOP